MDECRDEYEGGWRPRFEYLAAGYIRPGPVKQRGGLAAATETLGEFDPSRAPSANPWTYEICTGDARTELEPAPCGKKAGPDPKLALNNGRRGFEQ